MQDIGRHDQIEISPTEALRLRRLLDIQGIEADERILLKFLSRRRQECSGYIAENVFRSLAGQTLLVVGLGHIGAIVARNAKALGMQVIATRRSRTPPRAGASVGAVVPMAAAPTIRGAPGLAHPRARDGACTVAEEPPQKKRLLVDERLVVILGHELR